jgi:mannose-6-phosphate isomerase-like protein (cupin superfamily)
MKKAIPILVAACIGFALGSASRPQQRRASRSMLATAFAQSQAAQQQGQPEVMPFGYGRPGSPALASDAPPPMYWSGDDIKKGHADMAARAAAAATQPGSGSTQAFGGGPVRVRTRNFSMSMLYRVHRDQPVLSLTKVNSVWDDAEQHAGVYDFYIITGGSGEMIVGGKIANRQNLADKDGLVPGEYRGQPIVGGQTFKVKAGDWLLIPPDAPHQPKPDAGGFSYMIMKINVGIYPWSLVR